jgi:hypothetical protein
MTHFLLRAHIDSQGDKSIVRHAGPGVPAVGDYFLMKTSPPAGASLKARTNGTSGKLP